MTDQIQPVKTVQLIEFKDIQTIGISYDSQWIAFGGQNGNLILWNQYQNQYIDGSTQSYHIPPIKKITFAKNSQYLVYTLKSNELFENEKPPFWYFLTQNNENIQNISFNRISQIPTVCSDFTSDSLNLILCDESYISIVSIESQTLIKKIQVEDIVRSISDCNNNKILINVDNTNLVNFYHINKGKSIYKHKQLSQIGFEVEISDNQSFYIVQGNISTEIRNIQTKRLIRKFYNNTYNPFLQLSQDNKNLIIFNPQKLLIVIDLCTAQQQELNIQKNIYSLTTNFKQFVGRLNNEILLYAF